MTKKLKIVVKEPLMPPTVKEVESGLENFQDIVGGYIESISFGNYYLTLNEEGKLKGLKPNLKFPGDVVVGTVYVIKVDEDGYEEGLTDEEVSEVISMLEEIAIDNEAEVFHYSRIIKEMFH